MAERTDISLRGLAIGAAIVLGGIAASLGVAALVASRLEGWNGAEPPAIAGAVLQTAPRQDLAAFLREKNARLHSRGPLEGDARHVHIPIEEAMRLLAERSGR